jgi:hypothetical protein
MNDLDWNDYFDNDREAGIDVTHQDGPEHLDDAILRLVKEGVDHAQIAEQLDTGLTYIGLVIKWNRL